MTSRSRPETLPQRFARHYTPEPNSGCWLWTGALVRNDQRPNRVQYGIIGYDRGRNILAHRAAYLLEYGSIPEGEMVLHKCNNPACVNPKHLYAGTGTDNLNDAIRCGAKLTGEKCSFAKLTNAQVVEIRKRVEAGAVQKKLAVEYGVSRSQINRIVKRTRRTHEV